MADFPFSNTGAVARDIGTTKKMEPVNIASTANVDLQSVAIDDTIDGVTLVDGHAILFKDQTDASENGIYIISDQGVSRRSDFDAANEIDPSFIIPVLAGTANGGKAFELDDPGAVVTIGTTDLEFSEYTAWLGAVARTL